MSSAAESPDTGGSEPKAGWLARTVGGIGLVAWSHRMAKDQADDDIPGVTSPNPRAQRIAERANSLVAAGASDEKVLAEVTEMAQGRPRDLKIASTLVRQDGVWIEEERPNRVVRILNAAATGETIGPPRPEHAARFDPIAEFNALAPDIAYEELKRLAPKVGEVESTYVKAFREVGENGDNIPEMFPYWRKMLESLRSIVGPDSGSENVIIQSIAALSLATWQIPERGKQASR
jgi:hypothetical protein